MHDIEIHETHNINEIYEDRAIVYEDMRQHRRDVYNVLNEIAWNIYQTGQMHDWTKESFFEEYYNDIIERQTETDFQQREWYNIHTKYERHHINSNIPTDVNLIDIIEMITDCIVTGKATNNGKVDLEYLKLTNETLNLAYWNSIRLICENTTLKKR